MRGRKVCGFTAQEDGDKERTDGRGRLASRASHSLNTRYAMPTFQHKASFPHNLICYR